MKKWILALLMLFVLPGYSYAATTSTKDAIKKCETKYKSDSSKKADCIKKVKANAKKSSSSNTKNAKKDINQICKDKYPYDKTKQNSCISKAKDKAKTTKNKTTSSYDKNKSKTTSATSTKKDLKAVNVNKASASELAASLPGVGEKKAQAIIDYRKKNGKFKNANDLTNVPGLGDASVSKMKPYLKF